MQTAVENKLTTNLSPVGAWAFALGTSVGWGSLVVTSNTYLAQAGPWGSVLGLVVGAMIMLIISRNYAYLMQVYPEAGGAYTYSREAFGYDHGFLTAWFLTLTYLSILWANATSIPLFARYFLGGVFTFGRMYEVFGYEVYIGETMLTIAVILLTAVLCTQYKGAAARAMIVLVCVFSAGIFVSFVISIIRRGCEFSPAYVPDTSAISQILHIVFISPWAFIGFECISHGAEEFSFKKTEVFRVLLWAVVSTVLLYIFVTLLSVTAYPPRYDSWLEYIRDRSNLDGIEALPAFYAANHYMGSTGVGILMASLLALVGTSLIGNITALSRLFYAMGKDKILPGRFGELNQRGTPGNAIMLIVCVSLIVPFLGRNAIGWIVDVTTIGATLIYGFVSASAFRTAKARGDRVERKTGVIGLLVMIVFGINLLIPNLVLQSSMEKETYFLFIVWSVFGFIFFRYTLKKDEAHRFGRSIIVWVALLSLVLFVALIWMRQSMIATNIKMVENVERHYIETSDGSALRLVDENFIRSQIGEMEASNDRTVMMAVGMFVFSLVIMMSNYSFLNKRARESERAANTDPMTGVKSKHAYMELERRVDAEISEGIIKAFSIVVCDVNGLKYINDTYGHQAGDNYIRAASKLICDLFQHSPVFRIGGDEFVAFLTGHDHEIREELLRKTMEISEQRIGSEEVVVAAGLATYEAGEDMNVHSVLQRADERMYQNKLALKEKGSRAR